MAYFNFCHHRLEPRLSAISSEGNSHGFSDYLVTVYSGYYNVRLAGASIDHLFHPLVNLLPGWHILEVNYYCRNYLEEISPI